MTRPGSAMITSYLAAVLTPGSCTSCPVRDESGGRSSEDRKLGCGGAQQIVPAALLGGSVRVKTPAFPTEVPDVRRSVG